MTENNQQKFLVRPFGKYGRDYLLPAPVHSAYVLCSKVSFWAALFVAIYVSLSALLAGSFPVLNYLMIAGVVIAILSLIGSLVCLTKANATAKLDPINSRSKGNNPESSGFIRYRSFHAKASFATAIVFFLLCSNSLIWQLFHSQPTNSNVWFVWGVSLLTMTFNLRDQKQVLLRMAIAIATALLSFLLFKAIDVFFASEAQSNTPLFWVSFVFYFAAILYFVFRMQWVNVFACLVGVASLFYLVESRFYFNQGLTLLIERAKLGVLDRHFQTCAETASKIGEDKFFGLCEAYDRGLYGDAIVYDSNDEIVLPSGQHSQAWKETATHMKGVPFGQLNFIAERLNGHFYYVVFDYQSPNPIKPL